VLLTEVVWPGSFGLSGCAAAVWLFVGPRTCTQCISVVGLFDCLLVSSVTRCCAAAHMCTHSSTPQGLLRSTLKTPGGQLNFPAALVVCNQSTGSRVFQPIQGTPRTSQTAIECQASVFACQASVFARSSTREKVPSDRCVKTVERAPRAAELAVNALGCLFSAARVWLACGALS
jgi:hypothetical protein